MICQSEFPIKGECWADQHLTKLATEADETEIYISGQEIGANAVRNKTAMNTLLARSILRPNCYGLGGIPASEARRIFRDVLWLLLGSRNV